jgi:hypothetical protein
MSFNYGKPLKRNKTQQMQENRMWVDLGSKRLLEYFSDPKRKERREKQTCKYCYYYASHVGGAAITTSLCAECSQEMIFGSTCTDYCCDECAKKLGICKRCGATLD